MKSNIVVFYFITITFFILCVKQNYASDKTLENTSVQFFLYSNPKNPNEFQEISACPGVEEAKQIRFNQFAPWKYLIHGFLQNSTSSTFPQLLVREYMKRWKETGELYNIVVVDWRSTTVKNEFSWFSWPPYPFSVWEMYRKSKSKNDFVVDAGKKIGNQIACLSKINNLSGNHLQLGSDNPPIIDDLSKVHLIGFSLGAHVAKVAGSYIMDLPSIKTPLGRITALDPAGIDFTIPNIVKNKKCAQASDVIHTTAETLGMGTPFGDADFYPNRRGHIATFQTPQYQPWCTELVGFQLWLLPSCSHILASLYYAMSINHPKIFEACQCDSYFEYENNPSTCCNTKGFMGEHWKSNQTGTYYLTTQNVKIADFLKTSKHEILLTYSPFLNRQFKNRRTSKNRPQINNFRTETNQIRA